MKWTKNTPESRGWWWFQPDDDSPPEMTRVPFPVCVLVMPDPDNGVLLVRFPRGDYAVSKMGGRWSGPIPEPEAGHDQA